MNGRRDHRFWRLSVFGLALYAAFLLTGQFEHHDLACHVKTPSHCTACTSNVLGSDPVRATVIDGSPLADAGRAQSLVLLAQGFLLPARSTGRSPPCA